jgi:ABC-2 type transport system ATP-binding protein
MSDTAIKITHLTKTFKLPHEKVSSIKHMFINMFQRSSFEKQVVLKDINMEVKKGEFFGIVGRNGSGKSTLLKLLAGVYSPDTGHIQINGKLVPFIELGVGFNPELTGRENVYLNGALLGFSDEEIDDFYGEIVEFAELEKFMDQKLKNYSSGMQVRLAFSVAVRAKADILLIDEVLAVGDADFQRKCFDYFKLLKKNKKTVIFVSHDMGAVREYCDRAMLLDDGSILFAGDVKKITAEYSQLFIKEENQPTALLDEFKDEKKRWGDGSITITNCSTQLKADHLIVDVEAIVNKKIDHAIYGLHVVGQDGDDVTAMNNRMIGEPDLKSLEPKTKLNFKWKMLNIFSDGKYFVTLTLVNDNGTAFDWYNDASSFRVKREGRSTTAVLPPISVEYKIIN